MIRYKREETNVLTWQFLVNEKHQQINSVPASHGPKVQLKWDIGHSFHITKQEMLLTMQQLRRPCNVCEMRLLKDSELWQATTLVALMT